MATRTLYSVSFAQYSSRSTPVVVTVPAGLVYVVRDIDVVDASGALNIFEFRGSANQVIWIFRNSVSPLVDYGAWRGRQVFGAGQTFTLESLVGPWSITASGYQLTLP